LDLEAQLIQDKDGLFLRADVQGRPWGRKPAAYLADLAPLSARLELQRKKGRQSAKGTLFLSGRRVLEISGNVSRLRFELRTLAWQEVKKVAGPGLLPASIRDAREIAGSGTLFPRSAGRWDGSAHFSAGRISLAGVEIREAVFSGTWSRSLQALSLAGVRASARVVAGALGAEVSAGGSGILRGRAFAARLDSLSVKNLEYLAPDGMNGFSGGRMQGFGEASGRVGEGEVRLKLFGQLGLSEALYGPLYADLSMLPLRFVLAGELKPRLGRMAADLSLSAEDLGVLRLRGKFSPGEGKVVGDLALPSLDKAFSGYLRKILQESFAALKSLEVGGSLRGNFTGEWAQDSVRLAGDIGATGLEVSWPRAALEIKGGVGTVPFDLTRGAVGTSGGVMAGRSGSLSFSAFSVGPASLAPGEVKFSAGPNRFEISSPLVFGVGGGRMRVEDLALLWNGKRPSGRARLSLRDINLEKIVGDLGFPPMKGRITADLGEIRYETGALSTGGTAVVSVFDGTIAVRNMRLQDPFSPYATFKGDVDFSGLDLSLLTHSFSFGEMNGIVDGYVHNLRLFGLTPSEFDLKFETRQEGKRNISVKALNNLSILSQGGISAALSRGIYRFIDFYRYRKIGFLCHLQNDVFRIRGTALPGSDRYLVYGGWMPPKIDIIAPTHAISFKEMLQRLSRVERAGGRK
jgi:hypothetical protein